MAPDDPGLHTIRTWTTACAARRHAAPRPRDHRRRRLHRVRGRGVAGQARPRDGARRAPRSFRRRTASATEPASFIATLLLEAGVELRLGAELESIAPRWRVRLAGGDELAADPRRARDRRRAL
jgi:hypothetical protein